MLYEVITGYSNPEYDELLKKAKSESDLKKRDEYFAKAEEIFIKDDMAYMPIYYYTNVSLVKPNLKGVVVDFSGAVDFTRAYLTE